MERHFKNKKEIVLRRVEFLTSNIKLLLISRYNSLRILSHQFHIRNYSSLLVKSTVDDQERPSQNSAHLRWHIRSLHGPDYHGHWFQYGFLQDRPRWPSYIYDGVCTDDSSLYFGTTSCGLSFDYEENYVTRRSWVY